MVLERGWAFAMKSALRFNIAARIAPESNRSARDPENIDTVSKTLNVPMEIMRKYPKQECAKITSSSLEASTQNKTSNGSDTSNKDGSGLPNQVQTL